MNTAYLLFGSNINPGENIQKAKESLKARTRIVNLSSTWETHAVGNNGPNFLNCIVLVETGYSLEELKQNVINPIEAELGRVRTHDKYAPRTIDIDCIIFNGEQLDHEICRRIFIAVPLAELNPGFYCSYEGMTVKEAAEALCKREFISKWG
ncbi:MAG TPA: 2-amino-4-hydroxy-6-hydroxymethyldihydropteridine diphosphokinase [Anaerolineaceae bacterium]|nr:2-amino-4-hydroxy-6-hydroxymethyldihydropteridine diphosphokinase [Anaerolineaceae bacterium]